MIQLAYARVLNTLKVSGLTYSLHEKPISTIIVLSKNYSKNLTTQSDFNFMSFKAKHCTPSLTAS